MLTELHVKNIALIEEVDLFFENGLNVITGETGAGKSLLMGAVDITLGGKFSPDMIRSGADSALVELVFTTDDEDVISKLREKGYDIEDGEIIISRKLTNGRTVSRINGESCTAAVLKETAGQLINIHGQRENQILLKNDRQLGMLAPEALKQNIGIQAGVLGFQQKGQVEPGAIRADLFYGFHQGDDIHLREAAFGLLAALLHHEALPGHQLPEGLRGLLRHGGVELQADLVSDKGQLLEGQTALIAGQDLDPSGEGLVHLLRQGFEGGACLQAELQELARLEKPSGRGRGMET